MIDTDVARMRRLRRIVLAARSMANLASLYAQRRAMPAEAAQARRAALLSWRIARIATGQLRAHPFADYQRDPSVWVYAVNVLRAAGKVGVAALRGRSVHAALGADLERVWRELADARALTWSTGLSDDFGRCQHALQLLMRELDIDLPRPHIAQQPLRAALALHEWPYLAL